MIRRFVTAAALVVACVPVFAGSAAASNTVTATAVGFTFTPPLVSMLPGDHLAFRNADVAPHNITAADGSFHTTDVPAGSTGDVTGAELLAPGDYQFFCSLHVWMRGVLHVGDVETPATPVPGFSALPAGGAVVTPTSLTSFNGSMYVASYATGVVSRLPILPGGPLGPPQTFASGFNDPLGIVVDSDGTVFVSDSHASSTPGRTTDGRVWRVSPDGVTKTIVVDGLPNGRHNTNGMAIHTGRLYITNGSSTDNGQPDSGTGPPEVPDRSGTLLSVPLTAHDLTSTSADVNVVAKGMRNIYDVAFRPNTDEAWLPMNGPDTFDPYGTDLLLKADAAATAPDDFGFPACIYGAAVTDYESNNEIGATCPGTQKLPEQVLGLHVSADGLTFDAAAHFIYIAEFGNFFGNSVVGHKVVRVPIDLVTGASGPPQDVIVGGLPLDVTATTDGVYVADFGTGQITLVKPL